MEEGKAVQEKVFSKDRLVTIKDREKKKSSFYNKKTTSSTNLLEDTLKVTIIGTTNYLIEHQRGY